MNFRKSGTDRNGTAFSEATKIAVWQKATVVPSINPAVRRKDVCNAWIDWTMYGDTTPHGCGWEIDHIVPVARGGTDHISNLQPLQWQNNRSKGDSHPAGAFCAVSGR